MPITVSPHITLNENGVPKIEGTRIKVAFLVELHRSYCGDISEIQKHIPSLTLAQIYGALTYYYDHQPELDAEIQRRRQTVEEGKRAFQSSPLGQRLAALKKQAQDVES